MSGKRQETAQGGGARVPPPVPAFVRSPVPLDARTHAAAGLRGNAGCYGFAITTTLVPITLDEFMPAARHYPIVLSRGSVPMPMAVLGRCDGVNQYVEIDGSWRRDHYVPMWLRRYPFLPMQDEDGRVRLGIDAASNRYLPACDARQAACRLFDEDGRPSPQSLIALRGCERYMASLADTGRWVAALLEDGQLVGRCTAEAEGGGGRRVRDFNLIDALAHHRLRPRRVVDWHYRGWTLPTALQLASQYNWPQLRRAA